MNDKPWDTVTVTLHYNDGAVRKQHQHVINRKEEVDLRQEQLREELEQHKAQLATTLEGQELEDALQNMPDPYEFDFQPGEFEGGIMEVARRLVSQPVVDQTPSGYKIFPVTQIARVEIQIEGSRILTLTH